METVWVYDIFGITGKRPRKGLVTDQILKENNENDESTNFPSLKKN